LKVGKNGRTLEHRQTMKEELRCSSFLISLIKLWDNEYKTLICSLESNFLDDEKSYFYENSNNGNHAIPKHRLIQMGGA
jgi:hypothetical protein